MGTGEFNAGGNPAMDWHPIQGGVEIFLVASCHGNRDKLRPDGPLGSYADLSLFQAFVIFIAEELCKEKFTRRLGEAFFKLSPTNQPVVSTKIMSYKKLQWKLC